MTEARLGQQTGNSKQSEERGDVQVGGERKTVTYQCRNIEAETKDRSRGTGGWFMQLVYDGKVHTQGDSGEAGQQATN